MTLPKHVSYSSISTFLTCRQRYQWKYVDNYRVLSSPGQRRGTVCHAAVAEWYRTHDPDKAMQVASNALSEFEQQENKEFQEDWELIGIVLQRYFKFSQKEDDFELLKAELEFNLPIAGTVLTGFIDGVLKKHGAIWLLENKFEKDGNTSHVDIDLQVSIYMLAAYELGLNPVGTLYNIVRMREGGIANSQPWDRSLVYRNVEGLQFLRKELEVTVKDMLLMHEGALPVYRNPTRNCSWSCPFYKVCLSINDMGSGQSVLNIMGKDEESEDDADDQP